MVTVDVSWRIAWKYIFLSLSSVNVWCAVCDKKFSGKNVTHLLLTTVRDPETNQNMDTTKVKFDESMSFIRITYQM